MNKRKKEVKPVTKTNNRKERIREIIKKPKEKFLSDSQRKYWKLLDENEITICLGCSGVGKSFIAMKKAIDLLVDLENKFEKIIIVRPAVTAGTDIGLLPGNLDEKLNPYVAPFYYLLDKIVGKKNREILLDEGFNSKFFISGDLDQSDRYLDKTKSGLYNAKEKLNNIPNIGIFKFKKTDIVRNPIISKILEKYQ